MDAVLERAAREALGGREGAIIVMDPRDGRLRAGVNLPLAFEQAFPPGSTIKPFTALAALRAGLVESDSRMLCRERYVHDDFEINCSHHAERPPLDLRQALAHSCNYYFGKLGERLGKDSFDAALAPFGFGARTRPNAEQEAAGRLPRGRAKAGDWIGESERTLVTPAQLITAYAALFNGGYLYSPQTGAARDFRPRERARLTIASSHRSTLIEGMRGAIKYGTAERAAVGRREPVYLFGKTGTSTAAGDSHTHGWFVGFAADESTSGEAPQAGSIKLAVLVFLERGHGAESAALAQPIFAAYMRAAETRGRIEQGARQEEGELVVSSISRSVPAPQVRIRQVSENLTKTVSLDEYLLGVLAAESSTEDEMEALKAQAVVSRTFALKNLGRHAHEGFDFCSTTHCQRYAPPEVAGGRARAGGSFHRAVAETAGEALQDERGQTADAYFHASCGGVTANIETLWGASPAPAYLHGVRDHFCSEAPHRNWTDVIPAERLLWALRRDARSDPGARLENVRVTKRDTTGRAQLIALEGESRRVLSGWEFKIIVGRALGWNLLKSSRFEVRRAGGSFVFRGSGFGHGLGLCQGGAHVMAGRDATYRHILRHYFPGTSVNGDARTADSTTRQDGYQVSASSLPTGASATRLLAATSPRGNHLTLSSEHFRVSYPARARIERRDVEMVLGALEGARAELQRRVAATSGVLAGSAALELVIHGTTGDFVAATGQPAWVAAVTRGRRIELQPLDVLRRRGVLTSTLRHEYTHTVIEALGRGRTPRWLAEGLAVYVAGEGAMLERFEPEAKWTREEIEQGLARPASAQEMRALYAAAYREVRALVQREGEAGLWRRVAAGAH